MADYNSIHKGADIDEAVRNVLAAMRQETFIHTDGAGGKSHSIMIWIPKYKTAGFVAQPNLNGIQMGGFWVDKYQCSQPDATMGSRGLTSPDTPGAIPGVSQVLKVPWTDISWVNAKVACKNRGASNTSTASAGAAAANELTDTINLPAYAVGRQIKITHAAVATTVDADSAAAQPVLNVTSTTGFTVGDTVRIGRGTARDETKIISTIQAGVSLTMTVNLANAHTAVQADLVETNFTTYIRRITGFNEAATTLYFEPNLPVNVADGDSYTIDEYHLVTAYEWASMAYLACMIFGDKRIAGIDLPKGNNNWGRDYQDPDSPENYGIEDPVKAGYSGNDIARVLTGSGPNSWSLTGHPLGVWDLNGNIWEWVDLLMGGGNSVSGVAGTDHIINPGFPEAGLTLPNSNNYITTLEDTDVNGKKAALPKTVGVAVNEYGKDYYYQNTGERAALRGGYWNNTSIAGVFYLGLDNAPSKTSNGIGFRAAR
jgi:hypothetical protein